MAYLHDSLGRFIKGFKSPMKRSVSLQCVWCKNKYQRRPSRAKTSRFCSRRCCARWVYKNRLKEKFTNGLSQEKNPAWKGGRQLINGYVLISVGKKRRVQEHRLVMERVIGRNLTRKERIHHINGIKSDNRPENLELCSSQSEHMKKHYAKN